MRFRQVLFSLVCALLLGDLWAQGFPLPEIADSISWTDRKIAAIDAFVASNQTKALIIYQDGQRVYENGEVDQPYHIFSVRKSILSILYGIYVEKGKIDLLSTLEDLAIDDKLGLTQDEKNARIIDLLKARSGVYHPAAFETPGMERNRPKRGAFLRDEHWYYNNWDFNALTTIFEKCTGKTVFKAFEESVAKNIGLKDFDINLQKYHLEDQSVHPATLWHMSANDLSTFGRMLLNKGRWETSQVVPADWIKVSSTSYSNLGILGGYGYCWWVAHEGQHYPFVNTPQGTFSARGTGEQNLVIIPHYDMVIVHLTEVTSPEDEMMNVVSFGKLMLLILDQKMY